MRPARTGGAAPLALAGMSGAVAQLASAVMNPAVRAFLRRRLKDPLVRQLTQGVTPSALALALALGIVLGALPLLGTTTILCAAAAAALRLNQPAIQVANYAAYPLQLALYLPFFQAGAWLFGEPPVSFTLGQVRAQLATDLGGTVRFYAAANLRAVAAWALVALPAALVLHLALRPLLARVRLPAAPAPPPP
jgi:uncharacterized protein (DUF2062 family)